MQTTTRTRTAAQRSAADPQCTGKEQFTTRAIAAKVATRMKMNRAARGRSRNSKGIPEPYLCGACGHWHVGSKWK